MEQILDDVFRNDVDEASNADMLLRYSGLDVEYQVPTSSQRDQEFDNLVIDSEAEDDLEEDEQAMPDDGVSGFRVTVRRVELDWYCGLWDKT